MMACRNLRRIVHYKAGPRACKVYCARDRRPVAQILLALTNRGFKEWTKLRIVITIACPALPSHRSESSLFMSKYDSSQIDHSQASSAGASVLDNRWIQLGAGIMAMVAIANLQYGWTLFVDPIYEKYHWEKTSIQWAFTVFVLAETWLVPIEGHLVDRFGPRLMVALGGVLVGVAWVINAVASSLSLFYSAALLGGAGAGIVYGTSVGSALKWFPRKRGLAAGLTAAAFGAGAALTVKPIMSMIKYSGYEHAFFWFGIGQGTLVVTCALLMRAPAAELTQASADTANRRAQRSNTWREMVRTPIFWLTYAMFTMVSMGGLMAAAQIGTMARDYKVADLPVSLFGITAAALPFALSLDRIMNGLSRPFFGWVSDHLGRENTIFLAFSLEGVAILLMLVFIHVPVLFVLLTGLTFFAWGQIYSIFPALSGDLFGPRYATTNYGLLYTAKGTASLLVPLGSYLHYLTGSWLPIFLLAVVFDWTAALLAIFVLKPMRRKRALAADAAEGKPAPSHRELD
jgi:MFS transporter, OFA family, oxalate/formate antiporter